jgi:disulfide bond formation protein DsbB
MSFYRLSHSAGFIICTLLIAIALYLEHVQGLEPCPLCIIQRVVLAIVGLVCLVGAIHDPRSWGRRVYGATLLLIAGLGAAVAGRHLWLQHLPAGQAPECGPGLEYILENFPPLQALEMVLEGSGECAEVLWTFLGLSIPAWTLVVFVGFILFGLLWASRTPPA